MCFATRTATVWILCFASFSVCGCALGPRQIDQSRLKYNEAVQRTFQEEMLLNLVRLKYRESPEFITVGGIAAQYSFDSSAGAGLTIPEGGADILGLDGSVGRSERPTISYVPARGEEFQKGLLAPIDLESLQLLARTGWRWDRILRMTVQYMNGVDNATSAGGPTPDRKPEFEEFRYLTQLLQQLQSQRLVELAKAEKDGALTYVPLPRAQLSGDFVIDALSEGYAFKETPQGLAMHKTEKYMALIIAPQAKYTQQMQEVAGLLDLKIDYQSPLPDVYELSTATMGHIQPAFKNAATYPATQTSFVWQGAGPVPQPLPPPAACCQRTDIVVSTRSLLEVMFYLSQGISIPEEHMRKGLVTLTVDEQGCPFDWSRMTGDLLRVCHSKHRPKNVAVTVPYKGYWFYIDDADLNSQSTFTLLMELFGIEVRAGGGGGFLYTLSVGG